MKAYFFLLYTIIAFQTQAQNNVEVKPSTIGFHIFYNDFNTAAKIRSTSLNNILQNKLWSKLEDMQMGLGFTYFKGITNKIDITATIDGSYTDYLYKTGLTNGSSQFLLDVYTAANLKLLRDKHTVVPYLLSGVGMQLYNGKTGIYIPAGAGFQFNIFNEAMVFMNMQYRIAFGNDVNYHFYYSLGVATAYGKKKAQKLPVVPKLLTVDTIKTDTTVIVISQQKQMAKNIKVIVTDEETRQPLNEVFVTLINDSGVIFNASTNTEGSAIFNNMPANNYNATGSLNNIYATRVGILKNDFDTTGNELLVNITHNDPRFTLVGNTIDKSIGQPVGNIQVVVINTTQGTSSNVISREQDGGFKVQLQASSEITVVGKKENFISNIEQLSTKGLNRSVTLYVKLELGITEAKAGQQVVLNNIYFTVNKATLNTASSTDLNKLVQFLKDNMTVRLEIQGYTDNTGSIANNNLLSQNRAKSIVNYLILNGINKGRLVPKGFGSLQPIASNNSAEGRAKNRRVEMKVLE
jgi:outer membrane protein OmpA-like peptidoglycan-associated protein